MDKGVKSVRKSIEKRKKARGLNVKDVETKRVYPQLPQEEEKHGYYPFFSEGGGGDNNNNNWITNFVLKGMISTILFFGIALLYQMDADVLEKPKTWTSQALTEEFPFAKVNLWYRETLGNPLAFSPQPVETANTSSAIALPVNGSITQSFQTNGSGIMISPGKNAEVSTIREGVVIFAGNNQETNKTVIVQHGDGSTSTYGNLSSIDVHLYQFVTNNQPVGKFMPSTESETVFFSIEKDNKFVDPVQVIEVDARN